MLTTKVGLRFIVCSTLLADVGPLVLESSDRASGHASRDGKMVFEVISGAKNNLCCVCRSRMRAVRTTRNHLYERCSLKVHRHRPPNAAERCRRSHVAGHSVTLQRDVPLTPI